MHLIEGKHIRNCVFAWLAW